MKTILCFGDSNTWGRIPGQDQRYSYGERWTGILQEKLGDEFQVIEEGLQGRTACSDDPKKPYRNGRTYLVPCLESHAPISLVIIMLGTNDLKARFGLTPKEVAGQISGLVEIVRLSKTGPQDNSPQVLVISPPPLVTLKTESREFTQRRLHTLELPELLQIAIKDGSTHYLNAGSVVTCSDIDGVHIGRDQHHLLAHTIAEAILNIGIL